MLADLSPCPPCEVLKGLKNAYKKKRPACLMSALQPRILLRPDIEAYWMGVQGRLWGLGFTCCWCMRCWCIRNCCCIMRCCCCCCCWKSAGLSWPAGPIPATEPPCICMGGPGEEARPPPRHPPCNATPLGWHYLTAIEDAGCRVIVLLHRLSVASEVFTTRVRVTAGVVTSTS